LRLLAGVTFVIPIIVATVVHLVLILSFILIFFFIGAVQWHYGIIDSTILLRLLANWCYWLKLVHGNWSRVTAIEKTIIAIIIIILIIIIWLIEWIVVIFQLSVVGE